MPPIEASSSGRKIPTSNYSNDLAE